MKKVLIIGAVAASMATAAYAQAPAQLKATSPLECTTLSMSGVRGDALTVACVRTASAAVDGKAMRFLITQPRDSARASCIVPMPCPNGVCPPVGLSPR